MSHRVRCYLEAVDLKAKDSCKMLNHKALYGSRRRTLGSALLILGSFALSCFLNPATCLAAQATADEAVPCQANADDIAVYAAVLRDPDVWRAPVSSQSTQAFSVGAKKGKWEKPKLPLGPTGQHFLGQAREETRQDFIAKSYKSCVLPGIPQKDLDRGGTVRTGADPSPQADRSRRTIRYWPGKVGLSRVGFDKARDEALVYTERYCGPSCGGGDFFLLRLVNGSWTIVNEINLWEL
jgi:hypothetical protein